MILSTFGVQVGVNKKPRPDDDEKGGLWRGQGFGFRIGSSRLGVILTYPGRRLKYEGRYRNPRVAGNVDP